MSFFLRFVLNFLPAEKREVLLKVLEALDLVQAGRPVQVFVTWKGLRLRLDVTVLR